MRRALLGLVGAALLGASAPSAAAYGVRMCGITYAPACDVCVREADVCVPVNVE